MTFTNQALPTIINNIDIVVEAVKARDLLVLAQIDPAKEICSRLIASNKWAHASSTTKSLVFYIKASCHYHQKKYEEALVYLAEAIAFDPENVNLLAMQAECFLQSGKLLEAKDCYNRVIEISPAPSAAAHANLANVKLRSRDYLGALDEAQKALDIDPKNSSALQNGALSLSALERVKAMGEFVDRLQKVDPNIPVGHYLRGKLNASLENYREAIADYNKAIEGKFLLNGVTYSLRAAANSVLGFDNEVLKDCDKCLEIQPKNFNAIRLKGLTLSRMGRRAEAAEVYKQELLLDTDDKTKAQTHLNLSMHFLKIGDVETSILECDKALQLDQENNVAHNNRAWIFAHRKQYAEALVEIEKLVNEQDLSANLLSTRGFIYFLNGRIEDAKKDFDASLEKNPAVGEALFHRALIFKRDGDEKAASEYFERAKAADFKNPSFSKLSIPDDAPADWSK